MATIGENIKKYRILRNMTQKELATEIGKDPRTVSNWERGTRDPSITIVYAMAKALNISPEELSSPEFKQSHTFKYIHHGPDMSPEIISGDSLTVLPQEEYQHGDIVIASVSGAPDTCRRLQIVDGMCILNCNVIGKPPILVDGKVVIKGKVIRLIREYVKSV